jgi:ADP-ribose pyrophosphatase
MIRIREDQVIRPSGTQAAYTVIDIKQGSTVLPIGDDGQVSLVREFKYGVGRPSLELVSGGIDTGETPLDAAKRELREEAGLLASEWIDMGFIDPFTSFLHSPNYLFIARGLSQTTCQPDDGEYLEVVCMPFEKAHEMALGGEITHGASVVLLLKAADWLRSR